MGFVMFNVYFEGHMLENCKRLICSPSLNKVYCIVLGLTFILYLCSFIVRLFKNRSAYHLNGIFGGFFWTNGTALFLTKKTERIEPYHLIRSFGCKCFPAPLSSKARIMKAKVKHKNRRPKLKSFSP